jgi:hypothetical protein
LLAPITSSREQSVIQSTRLSRSSFPALHGMPTPITHALTHNAEADDFKRLIKLSYSASYTKDGGRALNKEELMRLLVMANGYGMAWCVEECAQALLPFNGYEEAAAYFNTVPEVLLEDARLRATTQAAGDALAAGLGRVEQLWGPGLPCQEWKLTWPLDAKVTTLPLPAVETLLRSEQLQLKSENYAFSLALWWTMVQEGSQEELQPLFDRLLSSLRFARMSPEFLAAILYDSWLKDNEVLCAIMRCATLARDWDEDSDEEEEEEEEMEEEGSDEEEVADRLLPPASRVRPEYRGSYTCHFITHFSQDAVTQLLEGEVNTIWATLGLFHGFQCSLALLRHSPGLYRLLVVSSFLDRVTEELEKVEGAASWPGLDDAKQLSFEFTVVRGTLGHTALRPNTAYRSGMNWVHVILECSRDALVCGLSGLLDADVTLRMKQHPRC